jgi:hypothetical protein
LKFTPDIRFSRLPCVTHHVAQMQSSTREWDIRSAKRAPASLDRDEAVLYTVTTRDPEEGRHSGYLVITKWNRWNCRTVSCGIWPLLSLAGVIHDTLALPPCLDTRMLERKLDSDRDQPYACTAPILPGFKKPSDAPQVATVRVTAIRDQARSSKREFSITLAVQELDDRDGQPEDSGCVLPTVSGKRDLLPSPMEKNAAQPSTAQQRQPVPGYA